MRLSLFAALAGYRALPGLAGRTQLLLGILARIPTAMLPLGTMVAFTDSTGSIAVGGLATGFLALATALGSPLIGRLADSFGPRLVLSLLAPVNGAALIALCLTALLGWQGPALFALCAAAGLTSIPIGSFTRIRWSMLAPSSRELSAAFSYESTVDELIFVLGPALVGLAAAAAAPAAPLGIAAAFVLLAVLPFALVSPRAAGSSPQDDGNPAARRPGLLRTMLRVSPALLAMISIGFFFGASQAAITERSAELGAPDAAGLVYALMGIGSATTAILAVAIPDRVPLAARLAVGGTGMSLLTLATLAQGSLGATAIALLLTGLFLGPTLVTAFTAAEGLAPSGGIGVAMTSLQAAMTVGVSIGSAAGGVAARDAGADGAYWLAAAAPLCVLVAAFAVARLRPRA
ncbi:MFS transporter [Gulosibacter sp. 10]|uniref:MFS transporter n=1 Tax=Gulosibacter sp. 10 TaxID=1255570 RepID=UPI00097F4785|nr:MFS transporter [Gulosibacter sp. 10]SJM49162.1 ABC transporter, permease protein [Gulosibacter sp. 10]